MRPSRLAISLAGFAGAIVDAEVDRITEAYVGTRAGSTPTGLTTLSMGTDDLLIRAGSTYVANASPLGLSFGPLASGADFVERESQRRLRGVRDVGQPFGALVGARRVLADAARILVFNDEEADALRARHGDRVVRLDPAGVPGRAFQGLIGVPGSLTQGGTIVRQRIDDVAAISEVLTR